MLTSQSQQTDGSIPDREGEGGSWGAILRLLPSLLPRISQAGEGV